MFDQPDFEWDHEEPLAGPSYEPQEVHIRTPNLDIQVRPFNTPSAPRNPRTVRRGSIVPRSHTGLNRRDLNQWLEEVDPSHGMPTPEPVITRSGRTSRPPARYDPVGYDRVRKELKDLARAVDLSTVEAEKSKHSHIEESEEIDLPASASVRPPASVKAKSTSARTTGKASHKSDPFQRSNKTTRD